MGAAMTEFVRNVLAGGVLTIAASAAFAGEAPTRPAKAIREVPEAFAAPEDGWARDAKTGFRKKVRLEGTKEKTAWYHLAAPKNYTPEEPWPVMIVLHGGPGGRGADDVVGFYRGGLMHKGVISIYPQALRKVLLEWNYPHSGAYLLAILRQVADTYRLDPRRVYLTGVSMGGGGAWAQGAVLGDVFAAVGPVSGWYGPSHAPRNRWLAGMPLYILHGEKDPAVPAQRSRLGVAAMKRVGHKVLVLEDPEDLEGAQATCVYREIPGAGHNCFRPWKKRGAPELGRQIAWMLAQKRKTPADLKAAAERLEKYGKPFGWKPKGILGAYRE